MCCETLEERKLLSTFVVDSLDTNDDGNRGPGQFSFIEAVADANANPGADEIVFSDSLIGMTLNVPAALNIGGATTVRGPSSGVFTISGQNTTRIFEIDDGNGSDAAVLIQNLTLINGNSGVEVGGAIRSSEALELRSVIIRDSVGALGGAVYLAGGSLTMDASTSITGNSASLGGGGIWMNNNTSLTVNGSTISGNTSAMGGGGIGSSSSNTTVTLTNATVSGNMANGGNGGGIIVVGATSLSLTSTTVSGNTASVRGGGIAFESNGDTLTISNSTISGNMAGNNGGGILVELANGGTFSVTNTGITMNAAGQNGGGLNLTMSTSGTTTLNTVMFTGNTAGDSAGGFNVLSAGGTVNVTESTFTSNTAATDGGGIQSLAISLVVTESTFSMNSASRGGGIASIHAIGNTLRIENSTFTENSATDDGGAMYVRKPFNTSSTDPTVRILGSTLTNNTATAGGGLYVSGDENAEIVIESTTISDNIASSIGGGIMLTGINDEASYSLSITGSTINGNQANTLDGGGIFSTAGTLAITTSTISNNVAARDGGGIHDASLTAAITGTTISGNTSTIRGGGYYKARTGVGASFIDSLVSANTSTSSDGGGIYFRGSSLTLVGTTVSGNTANFGAGLRVDQTGTVSIDNSTITANTARGQLGGIGATSTTIDVRSSIIAGNIDADSTDPDLDVNDLGTNTNNLINTDPVLTDLGDFGGPVFTHMPMETSPALDAGSNPNTLTNDARGFDRDDGNGVDIGATEGFRPTVTLGAETVTLVSREVVINVTTANDPDGLVSGIRVFRDANNNGTADAGELIDTIPLGGTTVLPVEQLPVGTSTLLLIPVDNTGLLGNASTGTVTLQAVPGFATVTLLDHTGASTTSIERHRPFTVNVTSPVFADAAGSILAVDVFIDLNGNGAVDNGEILGQGIYSENAATGTGTVTVSRETSAGLPLGNATLLIRPATSRPGAEVDGTISTVAVTITAAQTAAGGSEVLATANTGLHSVLAIAGDGSPLLFEQAADGTWTARRLADDAGVSGAFTGQAEVWSNAEGLTRAAVLTDSTILIFTEQADGSFTALDIGATVPGSTAIARAMTRFTTLDGREYLAGYTSGDRLVTFYQLGPDSTTWAFDDISTDLEAGGFVTPVLDEIVSYVTAWNQWSIVGLDTNGDIQNIWVLPGTFEEWRLDNLSDITNAPQLASGLSVILTTWSGINLTALDSSGSLRVTWWVPDFAGDWVSNDLSDIADNSGDVDDRVIAQVMTGYFTSWSGMNYAGVNSQGDLVIYWWVPSFGGQWLVSQITDGAADNAYDPQSAVSSFVSTDGTLNVVGADSEGDVLRSSWQPGDADWGTEVLSEIATFI